MEIFIMAIEERITINAPAFTIFALYADVANWNTWDPDTKSASLNGAFAVGTTGTLTPAQGRPVQIKLVEVTQDRSFTVVGAIPGFSMRFDHELTVRGDTTEAVHRVTFSGFLRFIFGPLVGSQVRKGLPKTMLSLKAKAEGLAR
jgi:Polyketide cyclase / dehydrase and lipid transport